MLFGIENEYHTNSLYYSDRFMQLEVPYAMVAAAGRSNGARDSEEFDPHRFRGEKNIDTAIDLHERQIEERRCGGFTGHRLPNRMRIYVDMLHPEISTAECTHPKELLLQQKASERIIEIMRREATKKLGLENDPILVCKNNSSGIKAKRWAYRGAGPLEHPSWACHENYLLPPDLFTELTGEYGSSERTATWLAFLVSRIYGGSGKVGSECGINPCSYQLFQRADFISELRGLETTGYRALINTRDRPYADREKYRRLHVICGDALIAPWSIYLSYGITALFLKMLAENYPLPSLSLCDPIKAFHAISRDLTGKERVIELAGERDVSALEIQRAFFSSMKQYVDDTGNETFRDAVEKLGFILDLFDSDPGRLKFYLDFAIKKEYLELVKESGASKSDIHLESLEYHNMNPDEGTYFDLEKNGFPDGPIAGVGTPLGIVTEAEIEHAMTHPPTDSRAYFGGEIAKKFPDEILSLSWGTLYYTGPGKLAARDHLSSNAYILDYDPWFGSKRMIGDLVETSDSLYELIKALNTEAPS